MEVSLDVSHLIGMAISKRVKKSAKKKEDRTHVEERNTLLQGDSVGNSFSPFLLLDLDSL